jgi:hypothetical protein
MNFLMLVVKPIVVKVSIGSLWNTIISTISALVGVVALIFNAINVYYMRKQASPNLDLSVQENHNSKGSFYDFSIKEGKDRSVRGYVEGFTSTKNPFLGKYICFYKKANSELIKDFVFQGEEVYGFDIEISPKEDQVLEYNQQAIDDAIKKIRPRKLYIWIRVYGYEDQYLSVNKALYK